MDVNWYRRTQPTVGQVFNCIQVKKVGWYLCSLLLPMDEIWPVAWVPKWWSITWNCKSNGAFPFLGFFFGQMLYHSNRNKTWIPDQWSSDRIFVGSIIRSDNAPTSERPLLALGPLLTASFFSQKLIASLLPETLASIYTHSLPHALLIPHSQKALHQSANSSGSTQGIQVNILSNGDSSLGVRHLWPLHLLIWEGKISPGG